MGAFDSLTDQDKAALRRIAGSYLGGTRFSGPMDLISQTMTRLLCGFRTWPLHLNFMLFMRQTMRSVADADRQRSENRLVEAGDLPRWERTAPQLRSPSAEEVVWERQRRAMADEAIEAAELQLAGDYLALAVIESLRGGASRAELLSAGLLSASEYDAAEKRAVRRIRRCMGQRR